MKTKEFIDALERRKIVPDQIIQKLRDKVAKTDRNVTSKSVARYLIDKGYLSKFQAKQIFTEAQAPQDEVEMDVPPEQVDDTNELLKDLNPALTAPGYAQDATRAYSEQDHGSAAPTDNEEIVEVPPEMIDPAGDPQAMDFPGGDAFDPLTGQADPLQGEAGQEQSALDAFAGKKTKKNQWESRWLFIGSAVLGLLIIVGIILAFTIFKADATKLWADAIEDFNNGNYPAAIQKFERYINNFPNDEKVPDAMVKITNAELRIPYNSDQWETTLARAQSELPDLLNELEEDEEVEKFADIRDELSVILPGMALGFTQIGIESDDVEVKQKQLDFALEAMKVIDNPAFLPRSQRTKPAVAANLRDLNNNIATIRRQIQKEKDYVAALDEMRQLTEEGDTKAAFETYVRLTELYPELKIREELRAAMKAISLREADLVESVDAGLTDAVDPDSPIASSLVLATKSGQDSIPGLSNEMVIYLVNGAIYGIRAIDGHVVWRKFVGVETTTQPQWLNEPNRSDLVAVDQRRQHLMRLSPSDGSEVWKVEVGEPFVRPAITPHGIIVTTRSGKVIVINSDDGQARGAAQLPKTTSVSAVTIDDTPFIYQLADDSNLYVLSAETMECREVYYLAHDRYSVSVPPIVISDHLVIPVNGPNYCNLNVIATKENGLQLERAQASLRLKGQVNSPILPYRRWGLVMSDEGDLRMLEVNRAAEDDPMTVVADQRVNNNLQNRNYMVAESGELWVAGGGAGLRRYRIRKAAGEISEQVVTHGLDRFVGPCFLIGDTLFHARRRQKSTLVSVSAVNAEDLTELWRTDFGAPLAGRPLTDGERTLAVSAQGDVFEIDESAIDRGANNEPILRGSTVVQTLVFNDIVDLGDQFVMTGPLDRTSILTVDLDGNPPARLADLQLPADQPACRPIGFGDHLLVPNIRGQVFRIDPRTGKAVGAPFQPELEPNTRIPWVRPATIPETNRFVIADQSGRVFLVEADGTKSLQKVHELNIPGEVFAPVLVQAGQIFTVTRDDSGDRLVTLPVADQLEVSGEADLPGGYIAGPMAISGDRVIVQLDTGQTVCFDADLNQLWSQEIPAERRDRSVGTPAELNGQLIFAFQSGLVVAVDPETGETQRTVDLGQPISQPPVDVNGQLMVSGVDGTLHRLSELAW